MNEHGEHKQQAGPQDLPAGRADRGAVWDLHLDAYAPQEIAERVEALGSSKVRQDPWTTIALAVLAGAFIALGAEFYTVVVHDSLLGAGLSQFLGGMAFTLGLVLVVVAGAELFTGNTLIVMAYVQGKITWQQLLRNWGLVYVGNFLGALAVVLLMYGTRQFAFNEGLLGAKAILIAYTKVNYSFFEALSRGILCNALVTLAVWLSVGGRHVVDKIVAVLFPITAFVASGFEHCVANMYFIPIALLLKGQAPLVSLAERASGATINLDILSTFGLWRNLIPVTLGNIIGGAVLVGLAYWFIYRRQPGALWVPYRIQDIRASILTRLNPARKPGGTGDEDSER